MFRFFCIYIYISNSVLDDGSSTRTIKTRNKHFCVFTFKKTEKINSLFSTSIQKSLLILTFSEIFGTSVVNCSDDKLHIVSHNIVASDIGKIYQRNWFWSFSVLIVFRTLFFTHHFELALIDAQLMPKCWEVDYTFLGFT